MFTSLRPRRWTLKRNTASEVTTEGGIEMRLLLLLLLTRDWILQKRLKTKEETVKSYESTKLQVNIDVDEVYYNITHTHTRRKNTPFYGLFPGTPWWDWAGALTKERLTGTTTGFLPLNL